MRKKAIAAVCSVAVAGSTGIAWAGTSGGSPATPSLRLSAHVSRYYASGPSAFYDGDVVGIGVIDPVRFRLPSGANTCVTMITVSFQYRTTGKGVFRVKPTVKSGRRTLDVTPVMRDLASSNERTSTSEVFRARLRCGATYRLGIGVSAVNGAGKQKSIGTRRMLVEVAAWPAG